MLPTTRMRCDWIPPLTKKDGIALAPTYKKHNRIPFSSAEIAIVNKVVSLSEELVSNHYKMSANEWLRPKYDVKTLADLAPEEIVGHYPYLKLAEVHSAMTYYHDHRDEIDAEIQGEVDQLKDSAEANSRSAVWQKLKAGGVI